MNYFVLFIKKTLRFLLKPLSFIPAIVMMILIFQFSAQRGPESASLSRTVSSIIIRIYNRIKGGGFTPLELEHMVVMIHPYVRKAAHITEYFVLAITVSIPMYVYRIRGIWHTVLAFTICVAFACLDEYHQTFVIGRTGTGRDVLIDSIGIFAGVIIARIIGYIGRKTVFSWLRLD